MVAKSRLHPIEAKRREKGFSGYALAKAVGTTPSHIARIERGENVPSVFLAFAIADVLGQDVRALFPKRAA